MTTKVQLWQNGLMMGVIPQAEATELVNEGAYRVINDQAIEWIGACERCNTTTAPYSE